MPNENIFPKQLHLFTNNSTSSLSEDEFDTEFFELFSWALPGAFKSSLCFCRFEEGDTFYNTRNGYLSPWSEAVKHLTSCLQVTFSPRAVIKKGTPQAESIFESNWYGRVELDFFANDKGKLIKQKHIVTTQGGLYNFLWKNNQTIFQKKEAGVPPVTSKYIKWLMRKCSKHFSDFTQGNVYPLEIKTDKTGEKYLTLFKCDAKSIKKIIANSISNILDIKNEYMPNANELLIILHDQSNTLLASKVSSLKQEIDRKKYNCKIYYGRPDDIFDIKMVDLLPTLQFAYFFSREKGNVLYESAKKSFYKPQPDKKTDKDSFSIASHGLYIKC
ncbi:MAG: hypothetical protein D3911_08855 [Candidatus Electrothrix sp. AW3_4]|nr:hypothetical protein [Candidatus Electrothrix gigas]